MMPIVRFLFTLAVLAECSFIGQSCAACVLPDESNNYYNVDTEVHVVEIDEPHLQALRVMFSPGVCTHAIGNSILGEDSMKEQLQQQLHATGLPRRTLVVMNARESRKGIPTRHRQKVTVSVVWYCKKHRFLTAYKCRILELTVHDNEIKWNYDHLYEFWESMDHRDWIPWKSVNSDELTKSHPHFRLFLLGEDPLHLSTDGSIDFEECTGVRLQVVEQVIEQSNLNESSLNTELGLSTGSGSKAHEVLSNGASSANRSKSGSLEKSPRPPVRNQVLASSYRRNRLQRTESEQALLGSQVEPETPWPIEVSLNLPEEGQIGVSLTLADDAGRVSPPLISINAAPPQQSAGSSASDWTPRMLSQFGEEFASLRRSFKEENSTTER